MNKTMNLNSGIKLNFAIAIVAITALIAIAMVLSACATGKAIEDHAVTGAKAAYKCGKAELAGEIKQWTPVLADEVARSIDQTTGKPDWSQLKPVLSELKSDAAGCALAAVVASILGVSTGTGAQPLAVDRAAFLAGFNDIRKAQFDNREFELPSGEKI